ncbi:hypothetical protein ABFS83_14G162200 [Erythranthe nasuta]
MFSSEMSRNPSKESTALKHISADGEFLKSREFLGSDFFQQQSCGLERYRSAPSSFLAALLDSSAGGGGGDNSSSGDESEAFFSALLDGGPRDLNHYPMKREEEVVVEVEEVEARPGETGSPDPESGGYVGGGAVVGSYSVGMEHVNKLTSSGNGNNLIRQSSSPAGFFNGYSVMGEVGSYRVQNHGEGSLSGLSNNHLNLSSRFMSSIPENVNENARLLSLENTRSRDGANGKEYEAAYEPQLNGLKRNRDFNGSENQNGEARKRGSGLVSHLSLPKNSAEMENILQFQQEITVPCQTRAKRGCATHPRSIAERMRRTRISDNMKKLQDLFPDMDKQINTAEMLDLAVEYIKDLQKQVKILNDTKAKCVCSIEPRQTSPTNSSLPERL